MPSGEASIRDSFTNARPELDWLPYPNFNQDNLRGTIDETSPEGEPGVGVLNNKNAGGFAALSMPRQTLYPTSTWIPGFMRRSVLTRGGL
jgi:hypothetical protein